jgi:hypothetical protein
MRSTAEQAPLVTLSIVSHGHGAMVVNLLNDIQALQWATESFEVLLTLNTPEDLSLFSSFQHSLPLRVFANPEEKGFGANHNAAFQRSRGWAFAVVNPDVRLPQLHLDSARTKLPLVHPWPMTAKASCRTTHAVFLRSGRWPGACSRVFANRAMPRKMDRKPSTGQPVIFCCCGATRSNK